MMYRKLSTFSEVDLRIKQQQFVQWRNPKKQKYGQNKTYSFTEKSNSAIQGRYRFLLE